MTKPVRHLICRLTDDTLRQCPDLRRGQAMWNLCLELWPERTEPLRCTEFDPFYNDSVCSSFIDAVVYGRDQPTLRELAELGYFAAEAD